METNKSEWWDPWALGLPCGYCGVAAGQPCKSRSGALHAPRIDRGIAAHTKERLRRLKEAEELI